MTAKVPLCELSSSQQIVKRQTQVIFTRAMWAIYFEVVDNKITVMTKVEKTSHLHDSGSAANLVHVLHDVLAGWLKICHEGHPVRCLQMLRRI